MLTPNPEFHKVVLRDRPVNHGKAVYRRRRCFDGDEPEIMAKRVTLDAMIPREDFAVEAEDRTAEILFGDFPISYLLPESPIFKLLRKPDFQRETNHWSPEQVATFVASFLDNEVIPSLILWKSRSFIFVIDGGHRLSALRAWALDDYGAGAHSSVFFGTNISKQQIAVAKKTQRALEDSVGRYTALSDLVGKKVGDELKQSRATRLFTRSIPVQWIQGSAAVAETSFFKINTQGTPLDETEEMLIRNRDKPIAIAARAIVRGGTGHQYWSSFPEPQKTTIADLATRANEILFEPEADVPIKTIDVPLGGSASPVDALALLIEFLTLAGTRDQVPKGIAEYAADDKNGAVTIGVIEKSLEIVNRITGNGPASLGLHPAVYFYNEKGKYSRFLFLGMIRLITERVRNNDDGFFKKFTYARAKVERFLIENKSLIGVILQNLGKYKRVPKMHDLFAFLIKEVTDGKELKPEDAIKELGLKGRIFDIVGSSTKKEFSDDAKSIIRVREELKKALICPICQGLLDIRKSVQFDHVVRVREGGLSDPENGALVHPYCNSGIKN